MWWKLQSQSAAVRAELLKVFGEEVQFPVEVRSFKTDLRPGPGHRPGSPAGPECADADHYSSLHHQVRMDGSDSYDMGGHAEDYMYR